MKIKILKPVILDIDEEPKQYEPSDKVIEIDDTIAKKRDYENRYTVYSDYIEIVEGVKKEEPKKPKPAAKTAAKQTTKTATKKEVEKE